MLRKLVFKAHWLLGLTAGLVLAVMGVTGATLAFEDEIAAALGPSRVEPDGRSPLSLDRLAARIRAQRPAAAIGQLRLSSDPGHAIAARLQESGNRGKERGVTYVDPYSGAILGQSGGGGFFTLVEELHRFLALPPAPGEKSSSLGRAVTGTAAVSLVFFAISGLYLRWPREPLRWRAWLALDWRRTGRNFHRELHAVLGTWALAFYLVAALTGLTWSYDWYRRGVAAALGGVTEEIKGPFDDHGARLRAELALAPPGEAERKGTWDGRIGPPGDAAGDGAKEQGKTPARDGARDGAAGPRRTGETLPGSGAAGRAPPAAPVGASPPAPVDRPTPPAPARDGGGAPVSTLPAASLDAIWRQFLAQAGPDYGEAGLSMPRGGGPVLVERPVAGGFHGGVMDRYTFDSRSGALLGADLAADRPFGHTVTGSMLAFHSGAFLGLPGRLLMALASGLMPLFFVTGLLLYRSRGTSMRDAARPLDPALVGPHVLSDLLVVHASQTGRARRLAESTAAAFARAGRPVRLLPIARLRFEDLLCARQALFVVSTYGDGEPPDAARPFASRIRRRGCALGELAFAVLALGDREYPDFCRFGRTLDAWLSAQGATRLFPTIEVDGHEETSGEAWAAELARLGAAIDAVDWRHAPFSRWRLAGRHLLNEGSAGGPTYWLRLACQGTPPAWRAGDIAEISPRNDPAAVAQLLIRLGLDGDEPVGGVPLRDRLADRVLPRDRFLHYDGPDELLAALPALPAREYSIASIPTDGTLDLVVRQIGSAGVLGLGSGWLTAHLAEGGEVELRIRRNDPFHRPERRRMILIGNGTGIAGLRAHLRESARAGVGGHWLMFGERNAAIDGYFADEIAAWLRDGTLARFDPAWSRDAAAPRYVQELVADHAETVRAWVRSGAAVMVCGSLVGMAPAVDAALRQALGGRALERLRAEGRYRRDIY